MTTVTGEHWKVDLPDLWQVENSEECASFFCEDGVGTLQISSYEIDLPATNADLLDLASEYIQNGAQTKETQLGDFRGFTIRFSVENSMWREWYLCAKNVVLFATYNCDLSDIGKEDCEVRAILNTLICKK